MSVHWGGRGPGHLSRWSNTATRRGEDFVRFASLANIAHLPSDLTSVFTTATGGVNAVPGDPVGLILDISNMGGESAAAYMAANGITDPNACPGAHLRQATAGARPILARFPKSGVRNRLTIPTESLADAAWVKTTVAVTSEDGWSFVVPAEGAPSPGQAGPRTGYSFEVGKTYTLSAEAKAGTARYAAIWASNGAGFTVTGIFDLHTGAVFGAGAHPSAASGVSAGIMPADDGYRCWVKFTVLSSLSWAHFAASTSASTGSYYRNITGDGVSGAYLRRVQIDGGDLTPYQRVTNAYDVTEEDQPSCYALVGDGLSKCMVSDAITPNSNKVTAFAAVRKLSDTATGMVLESSANAGANSAFYLSASNTGVALYGMLSRGTAVASAFSPGTYPAPHSAILTGIGDIANDICRTHINGLQVASSVADQGTGNYGTHPLFLFARNQSSLFFNGYWFGGAIRWADMPNADRAFVERFLAKNTMQVTL